MQPRSLSARLLASVSALLILFFGNTIVALDSVFRDLSERAIRDRLEVQVMALLSASEEDDSGGLQPERLPDTRFDNPGSGLYGEILRSDGYPSWRSNSLTGTGLEFPVRLKSGERRFGELRQGDGSVVLALSMGIDWQFADGVVRPCVYSVAENREPQGGR